METAAISETTGIPMLEEGNADRTSHGSQVGESFEDGPDGNLDICGIKNYSAISLSDFICENVETINNSIQDGDQSRILCDIVSDTCIPVGECDALPPLEIIPSYLADASKGNFTESVNDRSPQKNVSSPSVVAVVDEPLNLTTVDVKDVNKLSEGGNPSDVVTMTIEEQQKKLNESISAIAKSLGLEDFLPENFQVDTRKNVLSISVVDSHGAVAITGSKGRSKSSPAVTFEAVGKNLESPEKSTPADLLEYKQTRNVVPVVRVITPSKTSSHKSCIKPVTKQKKYNCSKNESCGVSTDASVELVENMLCSPEVSDQAVCVVACKNEVCTASGSISVESSELSVDTTLSIESCDDTFPVIRIENASEESLVHVPMAESENTILPKSPAEGSKKMHILLTTSEGQQIIEIDDDGLNALLAGSDISCDKEQPAVLRSEAVSLQASIEPEPGKNNEEIGCVSNTPLVRFVQKLTTGNRSQRKIFTCPEEGCGHVFNKECKLRAHMISHKGVRPYKCTFDGCDWAFTTPYRLRRHLDTHMGKKDYICDFEGCSRRFTTVYNLNTHKKRHKWPNSLMCPAEGCEMTFANRRKMELHLRVHEDIEAPYKCSVCGKKYYSANCIASHYRSHQYSEDDFKCPFPDCGKKYDKICRLRQHIRHHTGERPYACPAEGCQWSFMSASKLTRHMRKHTGERKFMCSEPGCGKSFLRPEHLKGHMVIHSGTKPFQCPHEDCNARFTAKSSLYVHVKKHCASRGKIIYPCPVAECDHKFNNKTTLEQHLKKVHPSVLAGDRPFDFGHDLNLSISESLCSIKTEDNAAVTSIEQNGVNLSSSSKSKGRNKKTSTKKLVNNVTELENASKSLNSIESALVCSMLNSPTKSLELEVLNSLKLMDSSKLTADTLENVPSSSNAHSEIDLSSRLFQENTSGSARTDYCCNHILSLRAKKWRLLQSRMRQGSLNSGEDSRQQDSNISFSSDGSQSGIDIRSPDVMLASSSFVFHDQTAENLVQNHFLPDEPSSNCIYQDDNILVNSSTFGSELDMPSSLLSDHTDSEGSEITQDSSAAVFSTSSAVDEFAESAMSLHGLD